MTHVCPNCGGTDVLESMQTCYIEYGVAPLQVVLTVEQPVLRCDDYECCETWTDHRGEDAREAAIALYKRVFTADAQAEIEALKKRIEDYKAWGKVIEAARFNYWVVSSPDVPTPHVMGASSHVSIARLEKVDIVVLSGPYFTNHEAEEAAAKALTACN